MTMFEATNSLSQIKTDNEVFSTAGSHSNILPEVASQYSKTHAYRIVTGVICYSFWRSQRLVVTVDNKILRQRLQHMYTDGGCFAVTPRNHTQALPGSPRLLHTVHLQMCSHSKITQMLRQRLQHLHCQRALFSDTEEPYTSSAWRRHNSCTLYTCKCIHIPP